MKTQNFAAFLPSKGAPNHVVDEAPYNKPAPHEVVIRNKAVAINPADVGIQKMGIIIDSYPAILGCDVAGIVEEVGSEVTDFHVGERVIGPAKPLPGGIYKYSGFQRFTVLEMPLVAKIPEGTSFTDAVVLPLAINTAATCLFEKDTLELDLPPGSGKNGKVLLVWGASSSVGSCGVQLAVAAGYEVFGIASAKNHALVKSLGASHCFDQQDPNLVATIIEALKGKYCVGAYNAIAQEDTFGILSEVLRQSDGRQLVASVMAGAENFSSGDVEVKTNFGVAWTFAKSHVGRHIWRSYVEPAMASGALRCMPPAEIVGFGLQDIQKAIDLLGQGVSAKKLVVAL